jgi:hypothetical protein
MTSFSFSSGIPGAPSQIVELELREDVKAAAFPRAPQTLGAILKELAAIDDGVGFHHNTIFPASEFWPWIAAGIPSPLGYRWLRNYFKTAATAIGRPELRVHDLRRLFAKLASDAGAPTAQV